MPKLIDLGPAPKGLIDLGPAPPERTIGRLGPERIPYLDTPEEAAKKAKSQLDTATELDESLWDVEDNWDVFDPSDAPPAKEEEWGWKMPDFPIEAAAAEFEKRRKADEPVVQLVKDYFAPEIEDEKSVDWLPADPSEMGQPPKPEELPLQAKLSSLSDSDIPFVVKVVKENEKEFDRGFVQAVQREQRVREATGWIKSLPEPGRSAFIIFERQGNIFNLAEFTSRAFGVERLWKQRAGDTSIVIEAADRVLAEKNQKDAFNWTRVADMPAAIGRVIAEFAVLPNISSKIAAFGQLPVKAQAIISASTKFALREAATLPQVGETAEEKIAAVGKAAAVGAAIGGAGTYFPNPFIRIPTIAGGFAAIDVARGASVDEILEGTVLYLGFEAVGLIRHGMATRGARLARRRLAKQVRAARQYNPNLKNVPDEAIARSLKLAKDITFWQRELKKGKVTQEVADIRINAAGDELGRILTAIEKSGGRPGQAKPVKPPSKALPAVPEAKLPAEGIKAPAVAEKPAVEGKQPWEMTRDEFVASPEGQKLKERYGEGYRGSEDHWMRVILGRIQRGESVPREVLEEYKGEKWADEALAKVAEPPAATSIGIGATIRISDKPTTAHLTDAAGREGKVTDIKYKRNGQPDSWAVEIDGEEFIVDSPKDIQFAAEALTKIVKPVAEGKVVEKKFYTSVPEEWRKHKELSDWGKKGIRARGNLKIGKRKTFIWSDEFGQIPTRLPKSTMGAFQAKTDEIWYVTNRKKGVENYYLVPKRVIAEVRKELGEEAFKRAPKPIPTPRQVLQYAIQSANITGDIHPGEIIERTLADEEVGLTEVDLTDNQKRVLEEYRRDYEQDRQEVLRDIQERVEEKVSDIEAEERLAVEEEHLADEVGDFLGSLVKERPKDLLGRPVLEGGVAGVQAEFLEKEKYRLPEPDIEGQIKFEANKPPGERNAGFIYIPPITVGEKAATENPNIYIKDRQKDIGILQHRILSSTNQAYNTKNPDIIKAAETMAETGIVMQNEIRSALSEDKGIWKQLPNEYKANKGEKFVDLMDKYYTPEDIAGSNLLPDVKEVLTHFKQQNEMMRQEILKQKREMTTAILQHKSKAELVEMAESRGIPTTKAGKTKQIDRTKREMAKDLAQFEVPDDWGRKWAHWPHTFFGQYQLSFVDTKGKTHFIGRAQTKIEAYTKLADWKEARKRAEFDDADKVKLIADPEFNFPLDVLRLSKAHYYALEGQLKEAADFERQEIEDALRGIIGKRESKQKWFGALQHRKGAPGWSKDFWRVWDRYNAQFHRWKYLTDMNHAVEPLIEKVRAQGLPGWADYLEETKDFMWGRKRSSLGREFDQLLATTPIVGDYVKPFALERWCGLAKTINYWRHLQTGRFYVINTLQLAQTLWPVVGEKGLMQGIKLYYTDKGQDLLRQHKVAGISGKLHEMGMRRTRKWERWTPAGASELRNQGIAFLALYDQGKKRGMSDADAARHGRLRGQLFTQFIYTPSDIPKYMRGPVGGLILQYKRFNLKNLELVSRLAREGKWGGVARWVAALTSLGGLSTFLKVLPSGIAGYLTYKTYKAIREKYGKETADVIHHGLPGLVGMDLSGSITPIDVPYGRNPAEKIGNILLGPTGQTLTRLGTDLLEKKVSKEIGIPGRALQTLINTSPTVKQFQYLLKALEQDTSNYDSKQRMQYELDTWDLWKKAFGFRPETESLQRLQFEAMLYVKDEYDSTIDDVVLSLINEEYEDAAEAVKHFNASFPEVSISGEAVQSRLKSRGLSHILTLTQRGYMELPKPLRVLFAGEAETIEK